MACGGPRLVTVDCLWVAAETDEGGVAPAHITLTPDESERIRVAVVEDVSLGTGRAWRASVWMAAFQAAMAADEELADWLVAVDVQTGGRSIDGPSAGGLLAAGMMAGMTGAKPRVEFTMTGTVNPDGTIGPVRGIPEKLRAAIARGKTTLGYPVGQGDAVAKVRLPAGVKAVEIADVYAAYEHLTGRQVDRPDPVSSKAMRLPKAVDDEIRLRAEGWLEEAESAAARYAALGLEHPDLRAMLDKARKDSAAARRDLKEGRVAPAYWRAVNLAVSARAAAEIGVLLAGDDRIASVRAVTAVLDRVEGAIRDATGRIDDVHPGRPADLMTLVDAHEALVSSLRALRRTRRPMKVLKAASDASDEVVSMAIGVVYDLVVAEVNANVARQNVGFRRGSGLAPVADSAITRLAVALQSAASANLTYFEAAAGSEAAFRDAAYQRARAVPSIVNGSLKSRLERGTSRKIGRLAGALSVYVNASLLIARHYAVEADADDSGRVLSIGRERAFEVMLELAERSARQHAARAVRATGEVPVPSRIAYQIGMAYRERGTPADRLEALEQLWRASLFSRLVVQLSGG